MLNRISNARYWTSGNLKKKNITAVPPRVVKSMSADKDAQHKTIAGSKKQKVFQYINRLPLTAKQKEKLFGYHD